MFASIYIPDFALQAALRPDSELLAQPVALIEEESPKAGILQLTRAARMAGVSPGMTSTQAMARCAHLRLCPRSPALEQTARDILLQSAGHLSPWIEDTAPGVCTLEKPPLPPRLQSALEALAAFHMEARIGVAETPDLALLAAHHARPILIVDRARDFLSQLPVAALAPSPPLLAVLDKWGIRTLGEFTALGKDPLARRLGPEALVLYDRATGNTRRPLRLVPVPEIFEESVELEHELETLEPLLFLLRRFLEQLTLRLTAGYRVASEIHLRLRFSAGPDYERVFKVPSPTCEIETLFRMLHTHLENFRTDWPIVALQLVAIPGDPTRRQFGLFETALRDPNRFSETLARLAALVGQDRVGSPRRLDTHRPDAFQIVPFIAENVATREGEGDRGGGLCLRRFRPAIPTTPPEMASAALGPYFNSGDWWDNEAWSREEWDIHTPDDKLCRIYRDGDQWFLEGLYD